MTAIVTLIPAYKTEYLGDLFSGLISQKMKDFKVILSDDSPDGEVTEKIRKGFYGNISEKINLLVVRGPCQGAHKNTQYLIREWGKTAPFVHIHLDDDIIYPDFYRAHLQLNLYHKFSASASLRWVTNINGQPDQEFPLPEFLLKNINHIIKLTSFEIFNSTIPSCTNWIGEFTNMIFDSNIANLYLDLKIADFSYYGLNDIGLLLDGSRLAPVGIIRDHLSGFRRHPNQSTAQINSHGIKCGHLAWCALAFASLKECRISPEFAMHSIKIAINRAHRLYHADESIQKFLNLDKNENFDIEKSSIYFHSIWNDFLKSNNDSSFS
jgi:hypothetical protein